MERRQRRTQDRDIALQLFIASQQRKLDVRALTVTRMDGMTIAGAGEIDENAKQQWVATWQLRAGGEWLVVSSWGGRMSWDVGSGIRRILDAS